MASRKQNDIWKAAESHISTIVMDGGGAVYQRVTHDETGWDGLVEFRPLPYSGPAENAPPAPQAHIQVKSSVGSQRSTSVTLSNAQKMCQPDKAWFLAFVRKEAGEWAVYVRHVWGDLMSDMLREVRRADVDGRALNRAKLRVTFAEHDRHDRDLVQWMRSEIDKVQPAYHSEKARLFQMVGYEGGFGTMRFQMPEIDLERLQSAFLGSGEPLPLLDFHFVEERFGIPRPFPLPNQKIERGYIVVQPTPADSCEVRIRGRGERTPLVLKGDIVSSALGSIDPNLRKLAIRTHLVHLTCTPEGQMTFHSSFDGTKPCSLSAIADYAKLRRLIEKGPLEVQIWTGGVRFLTGSATLTIKDSEVPWAWMEEMATLLKSIAVEDVEVCPEDLFRESLTLDLFNRALTDEPFSMQLIVQEAVPEIKKLLYYAIVELGPVCFCAVVARDTVRSEQSGDELSLMFGPAAMLEAYALVKPTAGHKTRICNDYKRHCELAGADRSNVICIGDVLALARRDPGASLPIDPLKHP